MVHEVLYRAVRPIISEYQHGFVKKRSTTSNLMSFVTSVINKMEKRMQVDAVYIDFSKAFDKVPHALTIEKLRCMGLPCWITSWLSSYLTERCAYVNLGGTSSYHFDLLSGVPQGSHLGPLIFVLFVNDLCELIDSDKLFYADDLKIFRTILSPLDCLLLQQDIDNLIQWCNSNGMEANAKKCKVITFTRVRAPTLFEYKMNSVKLDRANSMRDLGVIIDCKMNFREHIAATTAKAFALLGFIRRNTADFEDPEALKTLYCSIVRSTLEYAIQVWAPYHRQQSDRIESVQRSFTRFALRRLPLELSYEQRCQHMELNMLAGRRTMLKQLWIFDLLTDGIDCSSLLQKVCFHVPQRQLRGGQLLRIPARRTTYGYYEPLLSCCRVFNEVCHEFDFNISKYSFKRRISNIS